MTKQDKTEIACKDNHNLANKIMISYPIAIDPPAKKLMNTILSEQIMPLTVAERLQLIEEIWNSLSDHENEILLTSAQKEEIDRRLELCDDVHNQGKSWQEM